MILFTSLIMAACPDEVETPDKLRPELRTIILGYLSNPSESPYTLNEIIDLLNFYNSEKEKSMITDCESIGSTSNTQISEILKYSGLVVNKSEDILAAEEEALNALESPVPGQVGFLMKNNQFMVISFDDSGNVFLKGTLQQNSNPTATPDDEFIIKDNAGNNAAVFNLFTGNAAIKGTLQENQPTLIPAEQSNDFIVKDPNGIIISYVDESGNFYLKGVLTQNAMLPEFQDNEPPSITEAAISPTSGLTGAIFTITARIVDLSGISISNLPRALIQNPEETTIASVALFDDGAHGDGNAKDNIYGNVWDSKGKAEGDYVADITAEDSVGNSKEAENTIRFSIVPSKCVEILKNGDPSDKIDVVFVGDKFTDLTDFRNQVEMHMGLKPGVDGSTDGIFYVEPFLSNKDKFNVYLVNELSDLDCLEGDSTLGLCDRNKVNDLALQCPYDFINLLSRRRYRSAAFPDIGIYSISISSDEGTRVATRVSVHEFGHSFGYLLDEYSGDSTYLDNFQFKNCFGREPIKDLDCGLATCFSGDGCLAGCNPPDGDCSVASCNPGDGCAVSCSPIDPDCGGGASCNAGDGCFGGNCDPPDPDCLPATCNPGDGCLIGCGERGPVVSSSFSFPNSYQDVDCLGEPFSCQAGNGCVENCDMPDPDCEDICRGGNICVVGCSPIDPDCGGGASCNAGDGCGGGSCFIKYGEQFCKENSQWGDLVGNGCGEDGVVDCQVEQACSPVFPGSEDIVCWFDFSSNPQGPLEISCFESCYKSRENIYRPAFNTIMRDHLYDPYSYGQVNERYICQKINENTGSAGGICPNYGVT